MAESPPSPARRRRRKRGWKFKLPIFLILAGGIGGFAYLALKKETPPVTYAVTAVARGNLIDKLADTGTIELVRTVEVKSTIAGEVRSLPVQAGDFVVEGQLLAMIEPDPNQSLQLYQKRSAVERGRLNVADLERDLERQKTLFDRKMLSSNDYENSQMRLTQARNDLRLSSLELEILETKANLSSAQRESQAQLDEVSVLAPIGGIVINRDVEIGEVVASGLSSYSGGTLLFQIGDPSQMIVRGDIAEIDIAQLQTGQDVEIVVDAYPDTTYRGLVRWIAPVGLKKPGSAIVTFDTEIDIVDREPRLRQGMSCDIDIIFDRRDSVLYLPVEAIREVFDDLEEGQEAKGRRGRFVAYVATPDSSADSLQAARADTSVADADTLSAAGDTLVHSDSSPADTTLAASPVATDSTLTDTLAATDSTLTDTLAVAAQDSAIVDDKPPEFELHRFAEVTLQIGLQTSTRVQVLSGLEEGDWVAPDPQLIADKLAARDTGAAGKDDAEADED